MSWSKHTGINKEYIQRGISLFSRGKFLYALVCIFCLSPTSLWSQHLSAKILSVLPQEMELIPSSELEKLSSSNLSKLELTNSLGDKILVKECTQNFLLLENSQGVIDEFSLLKYKGKALICHIHTLLSPFKSSTIRFLSSEGKELNNEIFLPQLDNSELIIPKNKGDLYALEATQAYIQSLPRWYRFALNHRTISVHLDYLSLATEEQKEILLRDFTPYGVILDWKQNKYKRRKGDNKR